MENPRQVRRLKEILNLYLSDEKKARYLQSDGQYSRSSKAAQPDAINSQASLLALERVQVKAAKSLPALGRKRRVADRRANEQTRN